MRTISASSDAVDFPASDDPWDSPDTSLLGSGRRSAPAFPVDLLGASWEKWAKSHAEAVCAPVDYIVTSLLACAGAVLANVRRPLVGHCWSEPPVIWAANVGAPSSGKSPAMDVAFDLVSHAEERMCDGFDAELNTYQERRQIAKATRETWEADVKAAVKAGETPPAYDDAANDPREPIRPRIRVGDFTVEKLGALAAGLPRGLIAVRDELAGWFGAFDRYGGGGSDRAFAIEMYGGRGYVVDRVKSAEPVKIKHLSVGVLGGVQPDKLAEIIEGPDDGLAARFLWTWPDAKAEFRLMRTQITDDTAFAAFGRLVDLR